MFLQLVSIEQWWIQGVHPTPPQQGSRFFHFDIQIFTKQTASGDGTTFRGERPPMGNPGSATVEGFQIQL